MVLLGLATSDLAKMGSGPKLDHLLYISYLVICGDDISHSGLGPFFFCQCLVAVGGLNVLQFFWEVFFLPVNLAFPSVFLCVRGDIRTSHAPPVPTEFHAGIVYKTRPYIL